MKSAWGQSPGHEVNHGSVDPGHAASGARLVLAPEPSVTQEPGEGAFHDPSLGQHHECALPFESGYDLEPESQFFHDENLQLPLVRLVRKDRLQAGELLPAELCEYKSRAHRIMYIGCMDCHGKHHPQRIYNEVSLSSGNLLAAIESPAVPLFSATRIDWLSTMAALGVGSRPACLRTASLRES